MGIVAVSRNDMDSGIWTKMSFFFSSSSLTSLFSPIPWFFSSIFPWDHHGTLLYARCLPNDIIAFLNPKPIPPYIIFQDRSRKWFSPNWKGEREREREVCLGSCTDLRCREFEVFFRVLMIWERDAREGESSDFCTI
jgi:hypothetical protein